MVTLSGENKKKLDISKMGHLKYNSSNYKICIITSKNIVKIIKYNKNEVGLETYYNDLKPMEHRFKHSFFDTVSLKIVSRSSSNQA